MRARKCQIVCLIIFSFLSFFNIIKCGDDCGTPVECYIKARAILDQDRKEIRTYMDKLTENFETFKKDVAENLKKEISDKISPVGSIIFHSSAKAILEDKDLSSGWTVCDGRALLRSAYPELFAAIGTLYGAGDGTNSFNVPDLRGRNIVGTGQGAGLSKYNPGQKGGEETHTLNINEMPNHAHAQGSESLYNQFGGGSNVGGRTYQNGALPSYVQQLTSTVGGNGAHNNMQPFISHHAIIRVK